MARRPNPNYNRPQYDNSPRYRDVEDRIRDLERELPERIRREYNDYERWAPRELRRRDNAARREKWLRDYLNEKNNPPKQPFGPRKPPPARPPGPTVIVPLGKRDPRYNRDPVNPQKNPNAPRRYGPKLTPQLLRALRYADPLARTFDMLDLLREIYDPFPVRPDYRIIKDPGLNGWTKGRDCAVSYPPTGYVSYNGGSEPWNHPNVVNCYAGQGGYGIQNGVPATDEALVVTNNWQSLTTGRPNPIPSLVRWRSVTTWWRPSSSTNTRYWGFAQGTLPSYLNDPNVARALPKPRSATGEHAGEAQRNAARTGAALSPFASSQNGQEAFDGIAHDIATAPYQSTAVNVGSGGVSGTKPPPITPREPPEPGTKERKFLSRSARAGIAAYKALDWASETAEIVDALYDALPDDVRKRWKCSTRGLAHNAGQYGADGAFCKARALWFNAEKIDIEQAARNIIKNQLADKVIGGYQSQLPVNTGSAFEGGEKAIADALDKALDRLLDEMFS